MYWKNFWKFVTKKNTFSNLFYCKNTVHNTNNVQNICSTLLPIGFWSTVNFKQFCLGPVKSYINLQRHRVWSPSPCIAQGSTVIPGRSKISSSPEKQSSICYVSQRETNRAEFLSPRMAVSQRGYEKTSVLLADTGIPLKLAIRIGLKCQTPVTAHIFATKMVGFISTYKLHASRPTYSMRICLLFVKRTASE